MDMIDRLIEHEGGYDSLTNRPSDRGGWTRAGITLPALSAYLGRPATLEDLKALTHEQIRTFYEHQYLRPFAFVSDERVRQLAFDYAVNSGVTTAVKALQDAAGVLPDGIIGPKTIAAVNAADPKQLFHLLWVARMERYFRLAFESRAMRQFLTDPTHASEQIRNLRGWLRRLSVFV